MATNLVNLAVVAYVAIAVPAIMLPLMRELPFGIAIILGSLLIIASGSLLGYGLSKLQENKAFHRR